MTIHIVVPGKPKPGTGFRFTKNGHTYTGTKTSEWQAVVRLMALQECRAPLEGPLAVSITYWRPVPASWPKRPTKANRWPWAWWKKPDLDNLTKPSLDPFSGVAWHDDAQIVDLHLCKLHGDRNEMVVTISEAQEHYHGAATGSGAPRAVGDE